MRLTPKLVWSIKNSIYASFGLVDVYLFGSRTDEGKRGGDIDIAIDTEISKKEFRKNRVRFIMEMMKKNLDLKVDLVKYRNKNSLLTEEIKNSAIKL